MWIAIPFLVILIEMKKLKSNYCFSSLFLLTVLVISNQVYAEPVENNESNLQQYPNQEAAENYYPNQNPYPEQNGYVAADPNNYNNGFQTPQAPSIPQQNNLKTNTGEKREVVAEELGDPKIDFDNEDSFTDVQEAIKTEHYVRRAILSTIVNTTGRFDLGRMYINHLMGFSAIYQQKSGPVNFTKYTSGMQGLSIGWVSKKGHSFELGLEVSAVSNVFGGYRYIWRPETFSIWPYAGLGIGTEVSSIRLSQGPTEAENYSKLGGQKQMGFTSLGVLIPIVEVGIKAELRATFYGLDRMVLSQGLGFIIFL